MELCNYPNPDQTRYYEIEAIEIPIVYNRYGDYDPDGLLYVLKEDAEDIEKGAIENFIKPVPQPYEKVKPLVIRANVGEKVVISFSHSLQRSLSIHVQGLEYDVQASDGANVGYNKNSTTKQQITYTWYATEEGVFLFHDMGDTRSSEDGTNVHGLFGAIIVEAANSKWLNPKDGKELKSGLFADIYHPTKAAFREYVVFFHDELKIKDKDGNQPIDPHTGLPSSTTAISYRAEPMRNRPSLSGEHSDSGEDISMSSWVYGDPAKIRLVHGGIKETHVFHLHNHQWRLEGDNKNSTTIDSITISPQECHTLDTLHPGYPNFINGEFGEPPLQPPLGILTENGENKIEPTLLEEANFAQNFRTGALYTDTCPCHTDCNCKVFEIALVQAKVIYNRYGWHDPQGRFFVMKEELERHGGLEAYIDKIENQKIRVEPLVIRANAGDCIEIRLTNLLPEYLEESPFQMRTKTDIAGYHIHLVKFDTIVSDGAANGWNNIAGARQYETLIERFFADKELHTVFFHDHLFANSHQQHGAFGALIIEEAGATFHNIRNGKELNSGTQAVIKRRNGTEFREYALFVHDFALLFDKDGNALNPPKVPGSHDDPGVMGINYHSEPMRERLKYHDDPSYVFSSLVHGDPATPVLETYPGDEIIIRLLDGAHEEQHAFNLTGMSWKKEIENAVSPDIASQTIGISEVFNIHITKQYTHGDYLYYFGGMDDAWLGLWGIIRAHRSTTKRLKPICKKQNGILPLPPCPTKDAVIRRYEVAAIQKNILYNNHGDHDPDGLLFVPLSDAERAKCKCYQPKPLILRANAGEWIEVTLHNLFDPKQPIPYFDYPRVPLDYKHKPSMRVSLNPQFLNYDPICDSGINVGYNNREQTVGTGESKRYLWYADQEYGACIIQSFGDMRNHRYHGLFGVILIEPAGAKWYKNFSFGKAAFEEQAAIVAPGEEAFRECVVVIQNGIRMLDKDDVLVKTAASEEGDDVDAEDTGEKGYNYRSERFANRLQKDSRIAKIFNSKIHGDPATPVFQAYSGERVIFRTVMPADKPRNVGFCVHGHVLKKQAKLSCSKSTALQGGISIGNTFNMELKNGASCPGDYLYRSGSLKWDVESGMWGIFRVLKQGIRCKCKNVCKKLFQCVCKKKE